MGYGRTRVGGWWRWLLAAAAALGLAAAVGFQLRDRALGRRLVDDVLRWSADRPRPVQRPSTRTGSFEACLGPLLDAMPELSVFGRRGDQHLREEATGLREGVLPLSSLSAPLEQELARVLPWAEAVGACTEAPAVGTAPGLGLFADWSHPRQRLVGIPLTAAASALLLQARRDLGAGEVARALGRCSEVMALERDVILDRGLIGVALAHAIARLAVRPCAAATEQATGAPGQAFLEELARIRAALPPYSQVIAMERTQMQLMLFGRFLSPAEAERLPVDARGLAEAAVAGPEGAWGTALRYVYWQEYVSKLDELIRAAEAPDRDQRLAAASAPSLVERFLDPAGGGATTFPDLARRLDGVSHSLDLVESVARVARGEPALPGVRRQDEGGSVRLSIPWFTDEWSILEVTLRAAGR